MGTFPGHDFDRLVIKVIGFAEFESFSVGTSRDMADTAFVVITSIPVSFRLRLFVNGVSIFTMGKTASFMAQSPLRQVLGRVEGLVSVVVLLSSLSLPMIFRS